MNAFIAFLERWLKKLISILDTTDFAMPNCSDVLPHIAMYDQPSARYFITRWNLPKFCGKFGDISGQFTYRYGTLSTGFTLDRWRLQCAGHDFGCSTVVPYMDVRFRGETSKQALLLDLVISG
ncbi:unnamed protein product [Anisakis simplex]|uniref:Uncharacterized protein n=1 Tax=Anisakis simplex TaxID=6269 RepID=A0A0M3KA14_ANISI|nr:unnamed protein product [Anisakis simplex]